MIKWYKKAIEKYFDFRTRSTKNEFWWYVVWNVLVVFGLNVFIFLVFLLNLATINLVSIGILYLFLLFSIIPSLSITIRRLHDTGRSGWYSLIALLPILGSYIVIVALMEESQPEINKWGPIPDEPYGKKDISIDYDKDIV